MKKIAIVLIAAMLVSVVAPTAQANERRERKATLILTGVNTALGLANLVVGVKTLHRDGEIRQGQAATNQMAAELLAAQRSGPAAPVERCESRDRFDYRRYDDRSYYDRGNGSYGRRGESRNDELREREGDHGSGEIQILTPQNPDDTVFTRNGKLCNNTNHQIFILVDGVRVGKLPPNTEVKIANLPGWKSNSTIGIQDH